MEFSVVKDVFRGTPHVLVMRDKSGLSFKALTIYGERLIPSKSISSVLEVELPDGLVFSEFKRLRTSAKELVSSFFSAEGTLKNLEAATSIVEQEDWSVFTGRVFIGPLSAKNATDVGVADQLISKLAMLNYRGKKFTNSIKASSAFHDIAKGVGRYNKANHTFGARDVTPFSKFAVDKAKSAISTGAIRRFIGGYDAYLSGLGFKDRRLERRVKSLTQPEDEVIELTLDEKFAVSSKYMMSRR